MRGMNKKASLLMGLLVASALASPVTAQDAAGPEAEVRTVLESYAALTQAGDLDGMGELFSQRRGIHIIEGAGVNHGWADYRDNHLAPELEAFRDFRYRYFAIEPVVRGDLAYAAFRYELQAQYGERDLDMEGRGTAVLERIDGRWQIVHLHTSGRER